MFSVTGDVISTLSAAMSLMRRCRVNAALTIQLFSLLFHYVNMWLFNRIVLEPRLQLCSRYWGVLLKRRLTRIELWAEKQGLELAADCHLARIVQVSAWERRESWGRAFSSELGHLAVPINFLA